MPYLSQPSQKALYEASTTMSPMLQSSLRLREVKQLNWLHTASNSLSWNSKAGSSAFSLHSGGHVCVHSLLVRPNSLWPYVLCPPGSSVQETGLKLVQRYLWGRSKGFNWGAQERLHKEGTTEWHQKEWTIPVDKEEEGIPTKEISMDQAMGLWRYEISGNQCM